jgi:phage gp36-like protein
MAYATVTDMISRFGTEELIRISTPAGQDMDGVVRQVVDAALEDASALMDSYIRRRYQTPLDVPPPEVTACCCNMARFNLATGDGKTCSDEIKARNDRAERWLRDIAKGDVRLDLQEVAPTTEETAEVYLGREPTFR